MSLTKNPPAFVYAPAVDADGEPIMIEVSASNPLYVTLEEYAELDEKATRLENSARGYIESNAGYRSENYQLYQRENAIKTTVREHLRIWPNSSVSGTLAQKILDLFGVEPVQEGANQAGDGKTYSEQTSAPQVGARDYAGPTSVPRPSFSVNPWGYAQAEGSRAVNEGLAGFDNSEEDYG